LILVFPGDLDRFENFGKFASRELTVNDCALDLNNPT
jgi:hypothetical protein